jgi:hypothetical protein
MQIPAFSLHHTRDVLPRYHVALGRRVYRMSILVGKTFLGCLFGVWNFKSCAYLELYQATLE